MEVFVCFIESDHKPNLVSYALFKVNMGRGKSNDVPSSKLHLDPLYS